MRRRNRQPSPRDSPGRSAAGSPGDETYNEALADFDFWLRSDGHRRNPGQRPTLIAAALSPASATDDYRHPGDDIVCPYLLSAEFDHCP